MKVKGGEDRYRRLSRGFGRKFRFWAWYSRLGAVGAQVLACLIAARTRQSVSSDGREPPKLDLLGLRAPGKWEISREAFGDARDLSGL